MATLTATHIDPGPDVLISQIAVVGDTVSRRRIEGLLDGRGFDVVASADSVSAVLDGCASAAAAAVLVGDADLLGRGGAVETLRAEQPDTAIIMVSSTRERAVVRKALRMGVDGFVHQSEAEHVLAVSVAAVLAGQISVPPTIRERIAWSSVSVRERQVLRLVAAGLTNAEIADQLYLSESTVKSHLSASFRKLGVSSRAEAAAVVLDPEYGLEPQLPPDSPLEALERELLGSALA